VAGRPKFNFIQGFPGAETPGSFDAYRSAKDAGVSSPVEALLLGFIGNQGKVSFSENWFACEFGPSGTHRPFLGNPRRPIESLTACELKFPESIFAYEKRAYFGKNKTVIVKKWQKSAFSQMGSGSQTSYFLTSRIPLFFGSINASSSSSQKGGKRRKIGRKVNKQLKRVVPGSTPG
jgi:hypothetical protein